MKCYGFSITFITHPGKREELIQILLQSADQLQNNTDCIHYLVGKTDKPDEVWVYETWTSKEAHDAALEPEEARALIAQAMPLIAGTDNQLDSQLSGGKGLE